MGMYRLFLSLAVLHLHFGYGPVLGGIAAVYGFFMLSGYLMLMVYEHTYSRVGAWAFYGNRLLRIMPLYWVYLGLTVALMTLFGQPIKANLWAEMFFAPFGAPQLMPQSWSLKVELMFYALVPLLAWLGRKSRSWLWSLLALTVTYGAGTYLLKLDFAVYRYGNIVGTLPVFLVGMLTYHYRNQLPKLSGWWLLSGLVLFYVYFWHIADKATGNDLIEHEPVLLSSFALLWVLMLSSTQLKPKKLKTFDLWCGRLSYGVFLNHFFAAVILRGLDVSTSNVVYLSLLLAPLTYWLVERPLEKTRTAIKTGRLSAPGVAPPELAPGAAGRIND